MIGRNRAAWMLIAAMVMNLAAPVSSAVAAENSARSTNRLGGGNSQKPGQRQ